MIYCGPPFQMHWTLRGHAVFPTALRKAVATCLLMQYRQANAASADLVSRGMKAESSGGDAPNAAANDADVSNTIPVNSRKGYSSTVVLPPALWFCIFEYFGFNYSMPYRAIGSDGSYDASSMSDAAPNLVGSDAAPLGSGGFRLSNVDEEGAEDCDDAVEQQVGAQIISLFILTCMYLLCCTNFIVGWLIGWLVGWLVSQRAYSCILSSSRNSHLNIFIAHKFLTSLIYTRSIMATKCWLFFLRLLRALLRFPLTCRHCSSKAIPTAALSASLHLQ